MKKINHDILTYMKGYINNIEKITLENTDFRRVLYTSKNSQLVVMSLKPGEEIGSEVHDLDQFIRIEIGQGEVVIDGVTHTIQDDYAIVIPEGAEHNVINTGSKDMKLYTVYSPPEHREGIVHSAKNDDMNDDEHFDGTTTESF